MADTVPIRRGRGRPAHVPTDKTRAEAAALASFGITRDDIATYLGIERHALIRHYRRELATAATVANAQVAKCLFRQAVEEGNTTAMIFWLKTRARWSENWAPDEDNPEKKITLTW